MYTWLALPSPDTTQQLFDTMVKDGKADISIDNYPEYATAISQLEGEQKSLLLRAAQMIVRSQHTLTPICGFVVIGHADRALRKAASEREAFELEVSEKRAVSASDALLAEVRRLAHDAHFSKVMRHAAVGVGHSKPMVHNAATEAQMRRNRRVEVLFAARRLTPPHCGV